MFRVTMIFKENAPVVDKKAMKHNTRTWFDGDGVGAHEIEQKPKGPRRTVTKKAERE